MAFKGFFTKEYFSYAPLKERLRGKAIFSKSSVLQMKTDVALQNLVAVTRDVAPAIQGALSSIFALYCNNQDFPKYMNYHFVIQQQVLAAIVFIIP